MDRSQRIVRNRMHPTIYSTYSPGRLHRTAQCWTCLLYTSNRDLKKDTARGSFREDLFFRLNVVTFELPPLRVRTEDILPLSMQAMLRFGKEFGKEVLDIEPEAQELLQRYSYPGNIRELQNIIERAMILCHDKTLTAGCLPRELREQAPHIAVAMAQGEHPSPVSYTHLKS